MSGIISIRNFILMTLIVAATLAAGSVAQATFASSTQTTQTTQADDNASSDLCATVRAMKAITNTMVDPIVEVRCTAILERPATGAFVYGSAGATVRDTQGNTIANFEQPIGRTGGEVTGSVVPTITQDSRVVVPGGLACAPIVGCNGPVSAPANAGVRVLPGGSDTNVSTAGGGGTVTITETCVNTAGGCGSTGEAPAEVSQVAITRK